jgi:hypothetical protein
MHELASLVCGKTFAVHSSKPPSSKYEQILFATTICQLTSIKEILNWRTENFSEDVVSNICLYFRQLMESSCTALLTRLDPIRTLAIHSVQAGGGYQPSNRNKISIQWTGDIVPSKSTSSALADVAADKIDRALFSEHVWELVWRDIWEKFIFESQLNIELNSNAWIREAQSIDVDNVRAMIFQQLNEAFSYSSKVIHSEWLIPGTKPVDALTLSGHIGRSIKWLAISGLVLNYSSRLRGSLTKSSGQTSFQKVSLDFEGFE